MTTPNTTPTPAAETQAAAPPVDPAAPAANDEGGQLPVETRAANDDMVTMSRADLDAAFAAAAERAVETRAANDTPSARVGDDLGRVRAAGDDEAQGVPTYTTVPRVLNDIATRGARNEEERLALTREYLRHRMLQHHYQYRAAVPFETIQRSLAGDREYIETLPMQARAALSTGSTGAGAEIVATQQVREIMVRRNFVAFFRPLLDVFPMTDNAADFGIINPSDSAHYKDEAVAVADEDLKANATENRLLVAKTLIAMTEPWSRELFADARSEPEGFIARDIGRDIARKETNVFVTGNTSATPLGLHYAPSGTPFFPVMSQAGNSPTYLDIVAHQTELPEEFLFQDGGQMVNRVGNDAPVYLVNKAGLRILQSITDGEDRPLYRMATDASGFATFAGYRIYLLPWIPGIGSVADPTSLWLVNVREAMLWGDRQTLELESDLSGENFKRHTVQVKGTTRHDGRPNDPRAAVRMQIWRTDITDES